MFFLEEEEIQQNTNSMPHCNRLTVRRMRKGRNLRTDAYRQLPTAILFTQQEVRSVRLCQLLLPRALYCRPRLGSGAVEPRGLRQSVRRRAVPTRNDVRLRLALGPELSVGIQGRLLSSRRGFRKEGGAKRRLSIVRDRR